MRISRLLDSKKPLISFEFFPPKTPEGLTNLMASIEALKELHPSFVSMTYGAGGSTRGKTVELVSKIKHEIGLEAVAHLTCVGHTQNELADVLSELKAHGIENVLALRGDPPRGDSKFTPAPGGFAYASELVAFIRKRFDFCVGVAGYPEKHVEAPSLEEDMVHLKEKVRAGGDFVVTQLFFDNADYFSFVEKLRRMGIESPVIAGIMPVTDYDQIQRFTSMCGARIPDVLRAKLEQARGDSAAVVKIGIEHASQQCHDLLKNGAAGIHFYTLNKSQATREIFQRLRSAGVLV
jgi:methylenetetrahydrofolate reductase (NADPH)